MLCVLTSLIIFTTIYIAEYFIYIHTLQGEVPFVNTPSKTPETWIKK